MKKNDLITVLIFAAILLTSATLMLELAIYLFEGE